MSERDFAAIDLGSNSFHMVIAHVDDSGTLRVRDRLRELVQLGEGLGEDKLLSPKAIERALACLARFGQRLRNIPSNQVRIVATNTLRRAHNREALIKPAELALGHTIEVISGREEARLIYLAVCHATPTNQTPRLVLDIGGGSTEIIYGQGTQTQLTESVHMGCVSFTQRHFSHQRIGKRAFEQAQMSARLELQPVLEMYREQKLNAAQFIGCSGTIKAVARLSANISGHSKDELPANGLAVLRQTMLDHGVSAICDRETEAARARVLSGGIAVLSALYEAFEIATLRVSSQALREGVLVELSGREHSRDVQDTTLDSLRRQFNVNPRHGALVADLADKLFTRIGQNWHLAEPERRLLQQAALIHEIGLAVAHSQYHKHGHYLLANGDLPGFSQTEQCKLALIVRLQRRRLNSELIQDLNPDERRKVLALILLLRLSCLLRRDRSEENTLAGLAFHTEPGCYNLRISASAQWWRDNPLSHADLIQECKQWSRASVILTLSESV